MPNVTKEFEADPVAFLKKYVVSIGDTVSKAPSVRTMSFVTLKETTMVALKDAASGDRVKAYFLPWKSKEAASMDLKGDETVNYFFTSQMTNCRFSVLTKDTKTPKVAHTAGDLMGTVKRDQAEDKIEVTGERDRSRRLSVRGGALGLHGYVGQQTKKVDDKVVDDSGSAFVYGVRNKDSKEWTFAAQIVKGNLKDGLKPTDTVPPILNGNHVI